MSLSIGSGLVRIDLDWAQFRKRIDGTNCALQVQMIESEKLYELVAIDTPLVFYCTILKDPAGYEGVDLEAHASAVTDFEANFKVSSNRSVSPRTSDGKQIFLPNLFPGGVTLYYAGAGDDLTNGRAQGTLFNASSDVEGDTIVEWSFNDWVYVAGGAVSHSGAELGDYITLKIYAPATPVVPNGGGTGNCNLVDPGLGAAVMIVPAAGNGEYDVDLDAAHIIPAFNEDTDAPTGYWDWSGPDAGLGTVTPSATPGQARWLLFAIDIDLAQFVGKMPLLGSTTYDLVVPAIKPKKVLPRWTWKLTLHNSGHAGLKLAWHLITARMKTI